MVTNFGATDTSWEQLKQYQKDQFPSFHKTIFHYNYFAWIRPSVLNSLKGSDVSHVNCSLIFASILFLLTYLPVFQLFINVLITGLRGMGMTRKDSKKKRISLNKSSLHLMIKRSIHFFFKVAIQGFKNSKKLFVLSPVCVFLKIIIYTVVCIIVYMYVEVHQYVLSYHLWI